MHQDGVQRRWWSGNSGPPLRYVWSVTSTTRHTAYISFRISGQESVVERSLRPRQTSPNVKSTQVIAAQSLPVEDLKTPTSVVPLPRLRFFTQDGSSCGSILSHCYRYGAFSVRPHLLDSQLTIPRHKSPFTDACPCTPATTCSVCRMQATSRKL